MARQLSWAALVAMLAACVTVNVYFPASAAERAADMFIKDVYDGGDAPAGGQPPASGTEAPTSRREEAGPYAQGLLALLGLLVPAAQAQQPDINLATPAIDALKAAMEARHVQLKPHYDSGAVGMSADGLIMLRDPALVPLEARNLVKKLVADENLDRNQLYAEVAKANQHPEWEADIRGIFASRWVANAPVGWWYQTGGNWQKK